MLRMLQATDSDMDGLDVDCRLRHKDVSQFRLQPRGSQHMTAGCGVSLRHCSVETAIPSRTRYCAGVGTSRCLGSRKQTACSGAGKQQTGCSTKGNEVGVTVLSVFDAAKFILSQLGPLSPAKLQALCYYVYAWTLVWDKQPLFLEGFEAWPEGPICPELHSWCSAETQVEAASVPPELLTRRPLRCDQIATITVVLDRYADRGGEWLLALARQEEPWKKAWEQCWPGCSGYCVIATDQIALYYRQFVE